MRTYTPEQIKECKDYLGYCVKEGGLDMSESEEIIKNKDYYINKTR